VDVGQCGVGGDAARRSRCAPGPGRRSGPRGSRHGGDRQRGPAGRLSSCSSCGPFRRPTASGRQWRVDRAVHRPRGQPGRQRAQWGRLAGRAAGGATVTTIRAGDVFAAVLGGLIASGGFRHPGAPHLPGLLGPAPVLATQGLAAPVAGAVFGVVAALVSIDIGLAFIAVRVDHLALSVCSLVTAADGAALGAALFASLGSVSGHCLAPVVGIVVVLPGRWCSSPSPAATSPASDLPRIRRPPARRDQTRRRRLRSSPRRGRRAPLPVVTATAPVAAVPLSMGALAAATVRRDVTGEWRPRGWRRRWPSTDRPRPVAAPGGWRACEEWR
jgi:hypothetical protein